MSCKTVLWRNGGYLMPVYLYSCVYCFKDVCASDPHYELEAGHKASCCDCAFINGFWSEKEYIKNRWYCVSSELKAGIHPETRQIETVSKESKFSWEKVDRDYRNSLEYRNWRTSVFERDNFTCQVCSHRGGFLEAHHIKLFSKYKKLRFTVSNGQTLCRPCHKNKHKKALNELD